MITFDRLWQTMRKRNISQYKLIKTYGISIGRLGRLRKNGFTVGDNSYEKETTFIQSKMYCKFNTFSLCLPLFCKFKMGLSQIGSL